MRKVVKLDDLSPEEALIAPRRARQVLTEPVPKYELPENSMDPDLAYQLIHDELLKALRGAVAHFEKNPPARAEAPPPAFAH
jgi:glutamate/tyrosine decarboxylase-like PLP-dependent enzyme